MSAPHRLGGRVRDRLRYFPRGMFRRAMWLWGGLPDPFWIEVFSAIVLIAWAMHIFFYPGVLHNNDSYDVLERIFVTEPIMVQSAVTTGLIQLIAVWYARIAWRAVAAAFTGTFWLLLQAGIWASNVNTPGIMVYLGYAMMNLLTMLLLVRKGAAPVLARQKTEDDITHRMSK